MNLPFILSSLLTMTFCPLLHSFLSINGMPIDGKSSCPFSEAIESLKASILQRRDIAKKLVCLHVIQKIDRQERNIILEDGSIWHVSFWDRNDFDHWKEGHYIKVYPEGRIENIDILNSVKTDLEKRPDSHLSDAILRNLSKIWNHKNCRELTLQNGAIFVSSDPLAISWKKDEAIFIFYEEKSEHYKLWNLKKNESVTAILIGNEKESDSPSIFHLEKRLNAQVLGQQEAVSALKEVLFNYWAGLNNPKTPIGVFLFLGPTGVGKTELAKVLCRELFQSENYLIRLDMSQFSDAHGASRLIGSPPGYINHEEGGYLLESIKAKPHSIVLLDEIEKAHPSIQKIFLPIFDDGYIRDCKNRQVSCSKTLFIMTSNIGGEEICAYFNTGCSSSDILHKLEPKLIDALSPELYNRLIPIVFRPLSLELMEPLVSLLLNEIILRIKELKNIHLEIGACGRKYLVEKGLHPQMGARPLRRLIQQKIVSLISYAIISESIPENSDIFIDYCTNEDQWKITWQYPSSDCNL